MKRFKIGFLAVIAIAAMSFTIASHSNAKKRTSIANCYQTIDVAKYLSSCANATFTTIDCTNKAAAIGQAVKNDLSVTDFTSSAINCAGGSTLCCINFKSTTTDPCTNATTAELKGGVTDFAGNVIPNTSWVLVNDIECMP